MHYTQISLCVTAELPARGGGGLLMDKGYQDYKAVKANNTALSYAKYTDKTSWVSG